MVRGLSSWLVVVVVEVGDRATYEGLLWGWYGWQVSKRAVQMLADGMLVAEAGKVEALLKDHIQTTR